MRKKIILNLLIFIATLSGINNIKAFSINASSSVYVNSTIAVTVDATGLIGKFNITSSDGNVLAGGDSKWIENTSVTLYFNAQSVGSATITVTAIDVSDLDGNEYTGSRSTSISVVKKSVQKPIDINKTYSSNNDLESLSIEGYDFETEFSSDLLEYNITLSPGTEQIKILAKASDSKSSIKGDGEVNVTEGNNTIEVIVTAENGNEKIYKIVALVYEKDPILVNINKNNYTVIKRRELLNQPDGYEQISVKINGFDIPAYYNEVTSVTLIGLKDEQGNINLYSYNSSTGEYNVYKEYGFNKINLYIHEDKKSNYENIKININGEEVTAYKLEDLENYYLLYATNTNTGYEGYYLYDKKENSVQRYDTTILDRLTLDKDKYLSIVLVLSCVCFLSMLFLLIEVNRDNKKEQ